ncbi:MAG TPA: FecR domain-containing protein, partial [Parapedobacter sp.]|nr:FecR domain-containing protein [Parapedobacter sp.]
MDNKKTIQSAEFRALLQKYLAGRCTVKEKVRLETWYLKYQIKGLPPLADKQYEAIHQTKAPLPEKVGRTRYLRRWAVAAVAVLAIGLSTWFIVENTQTAADVQPGGNRATLTLSDGRAIDLSEAQAGIVVGAGITYLDGSTVLTNGELSMKNEAIHHSLTTPKGGTYQIRLPDGSKVWLNAASTLTYPSCFSEEERVVELEGEAYFEVNRRQSATSARQPFKVITKGQTVEVLGTQFNVSAYADNLETQTTLVEGAVRLRAEASDAVVSLSPGEQGRLVNGALITRRVNTEPYTAWKDGFFFFDSAPLAEVMNQLAKWYDVEVRFEDPVHDERLYGMISRQKTL